MKKIKIFVLIITISLSGYGFRTNASEETQSQIIEVTKTYTTNDSMEDIEALFEETIQQDGVNYQRTGIEKEILSSKPEVEEYIIEETSEPIYKETDLENLRPKDTISQDGSIYYLVNSEVMQSVTEPRTEYGKVTITFNNLEYINEIPDSREIVIEDSVTGKEYTQEVPRRGYTIVSEQWLDDFMFPITIYSVDADYYTLGGLLIPQGTDLSQYRQEFLTYLGLDENYYQIKSIVLQGEPFQQENEWIQQATAYGSRRTVDVVATFEGNIQIPEEPVWYYQCTYSSINPLVETIMLYEMQARATYSIPEEEILPVAMSLWDRIVNLLQEIDHLAIFLLIILVAFIMVILVRRKKSNEVCSTVIEKQRDGNEHKNIKRKKR